MLIFSTTSWLKSIDFRWGLSRLSKARQFVEGAFCFRLSRTWTSDKHLASYPSIAETCLRVFFQAVNPTIFAFIGSREGNPMKYLHVNLSVDCNIIELWWNRTRLCVIVCKMLFREDDWQPPGPFVMPLPEPSRSSLLSNRWSSLPAIKGEIRAAKSNVRLRCRLLVPPPPIIQPHMSNISYNHICLIHIYSRVGRLSDLGNQGIK